MSVLKGIVEKKHYRFIDGEGVTWQEGVRLSAESLVADGTVSPDYYKQIIECVEKCPIEIEHINIVIFHHIHFSAAKLIQK